MCAHWCGLDARDDAWVTATKSYHKEWVPELGGTRNKRPLLSPREENYFKYLSLQTILYSLVFFSMNFLPKRQLRNGSEGVCKSAGLRFMRSYCRWDCFCTREVVLGLKPMRFSYLFWAIICHAWFSYRKEKLDIQSSVQILAIGAGLPNAIVNKWVGFFPSCDMELKICCFFFFPCIRLTVQYLIICGPEIFLICLSLHGKLLMQNWLTIWPSQESMFS